MNRDVGWLPHAHLPEGIERTIGALDLHVFRDGDGTTKCLWGWEVVGRSGTPNEGILIAAYPQAVQDQNDETARELAKLAAEEYARMEPDALLAHVDAAVDLWTTGRPHADSEAALLLVRQIVGLELRPRVTALHSLHNQLSERNS